MADINNPDDKFSPYHNLTVYLTKGKKSEGFDDMINFLCRSKIHFDLTTNPTIYIPHMEDFWNTADEGAAISYSKDEYMRTFVSIGYTGNQNEYTIEKALMGSPLKYLCHTLLQCISQKRSGWHQVSSALASAFHGMITVLGFNFAPHIFEGLRYNLQEGVKQQFFMYPRFLQKVFNQELKELSKPARIYIMLGHKNNIFQSMRTVFKKFSGVNVPLLSTMLNIQSTPGDSSAIPADTDPTPSTSHPEQQSASTIRTTVHTTKDAQVQKSLTSVLDVIVQLEQRAPTSLEASLLGSGSYLGSIEQPPKPFHYFYSLNISAEAPGQDDIPSPTTTISEVLIDLAVGAPNPGSSPKKVHSGSIDRVNVERAITTPEARPKAPSSSKDSTTVDEHRLKLHNLELTVSVAMLEAEVSKLRHRVSMQEAHQCPTVPTPSLVSVGTQIDTSLFTDATKKGEVVTKEDDADSLEEWIQEQTVFQSSLYKPAFVQIHDLPDSVDEEEDVTEDWKLVVRAVDEP
ncbi:hypothetical protein L1987_40435 [Smallanthus sonchifolius]|uniref:Uncharacterized protein n=1 Tax=Smallanthus sonchifolius TaxID=185202 RepID=A0ACB9GT39_9ASTR|nr:hypothetical protein L1987_40435 [Smallanthus sonchifolius]